MDRVETPLPAVKKEMTKSSKDMVKAKIVPVMMPGMISGSMTLKKACTGVAPRSSAASNKLRSIWFSLGSTDTMT